MTYRDTKDRPLTSPEVDANFRTLVGVDDASNLRISALENKTSNINNTSDANKPVSTAQQAALDLKANALSTTQALSQKVDKVEGKQLSTEDYTTAEKTKLSNVTGVIDDLAATVRGIALTGLDLASSAAVVASDTILAAFGKLQAQVNARAMKGANNDITSLSGLTTALSVAQGGTGSKTSGDARLALGVLNVDSTYISGLKIIWNSPTSLTIGTGAAIIPSTNQILSVDTPIVISGIAVGTGVIHIYLYSNAGVPAIELTGAAPSNYKGMAYNKNLAPGYRYLGSFVSISNSIVRFTHNPIDNRISIMAVAFGGPFQVLAAGASQSPTFVSCGGVVPPTAITIQSLLINVGSTVASVASDSGVSSQEYPMALAAGDRVTYDMPVDSAQRILYYCSASGGGLYINIVGYNFGR